MIDITKFCARNDIRLWMNQPFAFEGKIGATNGHIIIFVTDNDNNKNCYEKPPGNVAITLKKIEEAPSDSWKRLAKVDIIWPALVKCACCDGTGKATKEDCPECLGEGETEASNDFNTYYDIPCASCDGVGYKSALSKTQRCPDCYGQGFVFPKSSTIKIADVFFQTNYLRLIIDEPGLEIQIIDGEMLVFRSSDTVGAIMALRY